MWPMPLGATVYGRAMTKPDRALDAPGVARLEPHRVGDVLRARRAEVIERVRALDASFADIVEAAEGSNLDDEHDPEGATIAVSREQVTALAAASRQQIEMIDQALARLEAGTYGTCVRCGRPIAPGRLEARPEAADCITCASTLAR